jgi:hypothetical protein
MARRRGGLTEYLRWPATAAHRDADTTRLKQGRMREPGNKPTNTLKREVDVTDLEYNDTEEEVDEERVI